MSSILSLQIGSTVPILLQIVDGATDQYPQAEIRDNEGNLLTTLDLSHEASGLYTVSGTAYLMPDEIYIKSTYIVYSDTTHSGESNIYLRDVDIFYKIDTSDYKATGFSVPGEYDATLSGIQTDLDNTDQYKANISNLALESTVTQHDNYKANVSGLALELTVSGIKERTDKIPDLPAPANEYDIEMVRLDVNISTRAVLSEYDTVLSGIQLDLDNPDQYKAIGFSVPGEYTITLSGIQDDLDDPDQYKADYDAILSSIQNEVSGLNGEAMRGTDGAYTGTPPTVSEIDVELTNNHGSGNWTTGSGLNEQSLHDALNSYSNKDDYKATGFSVPNEYDTVLSGIQADLDNPDQYKSIGFSVPGEYDTVLLDIQTEVSGLNGEPMRGTDGAYTGTPPTASDIDVELANNHGAGSWTTGSGLSEQDLHDGLDSYSNKGDYKATGFSIPGEYDATLSGIQADLDNPDQYKADVSGLASANEYDSTLSGIQNEVSGLNGEAMRGTDGAYTGIPPTVSEIDTELSTSHGAGSWLTGSTISGGGITEQDKLDIADRVWDESTVDHTISGTYGKLVLDIEIKTIEMLGLGQSNYALDDMVYIDYQGVPLLTSGRIRIYENAVSVGTDNDVINTYQITSVWSGNELQDYKVVKQ